MRLKFDQQAVEALQALGFAVGMSHDTATAHVARAKVEVWRQADMAEAEFLVRIDLPNGHTLECFTRRPALLNACEM
jgi:uncharacterized protein YoaH (UPF0181 family)